jgi:hypothetical protein
VRAVALSAHQRGGRASGQRDRAKGVVLGPLFATRVPLPELDGAVIGGGLQFDVERLSAGDVKASMLRTWYLTGVFISLIG